MTISECEITQFYAMAGGLCMHRQHVPNNKLACAAAGPFSIAWHERRHSATHACILIRVPRSAESVDRHGWLPIGLYGQHR